MVTTYAPYGLMISNGSRKEHTRNISPFWIIRSRNEARKSPRSKPKLAHCRNRQRPPKLRFPKSGNSSTISRRFSRIPRSLSGNTTIPNGCSRKPECWNPVTGEINADIPYEQKSHRTEITLTLAPNESVFIVYPAEEDDKETSEKERKEKKDSVKEPSETGLEATEYTVTFTANGKTIQRQELFDWSKEEDEQIRYYSGTAVYKTTFRWKSKVKEGQQVYLNLGKVCDLATVRVNGIDCGTILTAPYRADITAALKKGVNELEIEVTNTWANALKGADEGKAPFDGIWTNAKYRRAEKTLLPAGLLGPLSFSITE